MDHIATVKPPGHQVLGAMSEDLSKEIGQGLGVFPGNINYLALLQLIPRIAEEVVDVCDGDFASTCRRQPRLRLESEFLDLGSDPGRILYPILAQEGFDLGFDDKLIPIFIGQLIIGWTEEAVSDPIAPAEVAAVLENGGIEGSKTSADMLDDF